MSRVFNTKRSPNTITLAVSGALSHLIADEFIEDIGNVEFRGETQLLIDLSECSYISSRIVGAFVALNGHFKKKNVQFAVINAADNVIEVLRAANVPFLLKG